MKTELAVIGQGAVTPAGVGVKALLTGRPTATMMPLNSRPEKVWPVFKVDLNDPAFERWKKEARLRRASPISYFLVEAASQALAGLDASERAQTGLVIAFSTGCLAYSRRLFESIVKAGQKSASPALFPETVFNSPASHVATALQLEGAAYSVLGDEVSWIAALKTAALWLEMERVKQVVVLGAEEFDSATLDAYQNSRWLSRGGLPSKFVPSEGAGAVLLRPARRGDSKIITQLEDGYIFRSSTQAESAGRRCLQHFAPELPCYPSARHNWLKSIEAKLTEHRLPCPGFTDGIYQGEAVTASSAWHTVRALALLGNHLPHLVVPIWGNTHQTGALALRHHTATAD